MTTVSAALAASDLRAVAALAVLVQEALGEREMELQTYAHFAARDRLTAGVLEPMPAGVATRRYARR